MAAERNVYWDFVLKAINEPTGLGIWNLYEARSYL
jgi:hypothetical protein